MDSNNIRKIFLDFFKQKQHKIIDSASLIPADPTALFTSAGMQQFVPYLSGDAQSPYKRACSIQKCFRTSDIDEVGDECHHTFFEMLGNWSFGDYFKEQTIKWAIELLINEYNLELSKLWVTVFKGQGKILKDKQSIKIWQDNGIPKNKIKEFGMEHNFWGPVGDIGPCGPCAEIYYDRGDEFRKSSCDIKDCGPNCKCGRFIEIWNLVFMEYNKTKDNKYEHLPNKNIDTGAGLERFACVLQNASSDYETDLFLPIINQINKLCKHGQSKNNEKAKRIIADHTRAICFLIADSVLPSKEDRGYILRRIIRRTMRYSRTLNAPKNFLIDLCETVIQGYKNVYPELLHYKNDILTVVQKEEEKFTKTLNNGLKMFKKFANITKEQNKKIFDKEIVFKLYDTYGFPFELTKEMAIEYGFDVSEKDFKKQFDKHKKISRAGVKKKFGGAGDLGEKVAPQHTATHLLHQALRDILGDHVQQAGSDLTPERLRFDFTHAKKITQEEIKKVEQMVNNKIKQGLDVKMHEMSYKHAIKMKALAFFKQKYPEQVKVYSIGNYSKEICAGPHVKNTRDINGFKIIKVKSSGSGIKRIKAIVSKS